MSLKPESGEIRDRVHALPLRVYYEDTDVGGIVYYANYLKFMERGRSDMLRLSGIDQTALLAGCEGDEGLMFAVRSCSIDYLKPARFDDEIIVKTWLQAITAATLVMCQEIWRGGDLLATASVKAALLSSDGRPRRLPSKIRHILAAIVTSGGVSGGRGGSQGKS
jgi:acyl-CoA thioester hydrolase